jgi:hypothetical protein
VPDKLQSAGVAPLLQVVAVLQLSVELKFVCAIVPLQASTCHAAKLFGADWKF